MVMSRHSARNVANSRIVAFFRLAFQLDLRTFQYLEDSKVSVMLHYK